MPAVLTGINPLNANKILTALYNMVISQEVFGSNIKGTYSQLVDRAKVDGTLYGDQKWFYATDALASYEFNMDSVEQLNVLKTHRPKSPEVQNIVIDRFRQIALTLDNYLSKQAWGTEGVFSQFNSVMMSWIADTRRIIDSTTYNTFIGTNETDIGKQERTIELVPEQNDALTIALDLANLLTEIKDVSRDYNDYGFIRSYDESDLIVVFNAQYWNSLKKVDMPVNWCEELGTVLSNDEVIDALEKRSRVMVVEAAAGLDSTAALMEYAKDLGRSRNDLYEIPVWKESINVVDNELFYMQAVHQESDVVPENVDAIRSMLEMESDKEKSIAKTNKAMGIL